MLLAGSAERAPGDDAAEARLDLMDERFVDLVRSSGGKPCDAAQRGEFAAIFEHARDALACVLRLQEPVDGDDAPISRWALDSVDDAVGDVADPSWRRVLRVLSLAVAGQVLLSRGAGDVVHDALGASATLEDRGAPRPRDLSRPEHVLELVAAGRSSTPSGLRSLDGVANNLPLQLTSFVGRTAEMGTLTALVADTHLLTLTGPGGCGKTRLSLQLAAAVVDRYPDGVWIADMAPLADPALVPAAVAEAIGVSLIPQQSLEQTVTARLAPSVSLLVLDNCEHLTDACAAMVDRLVRACPRLTVVATSREPLGVEGEMTWRVPSLSLPGTVSEEVEGVPSEAIRLFVERAQATRSTFRLDEGNRDAVAEICRRLDGIPLAIELAAARSRALSPRLIADQLKDRFALLTGGRAAALPRHRTLEASLEWSYSLLDDDERTLFARLAVFAGGFDLAAAEAVAPALAAEQWGVLDGLSALVDKSLVVLEEDRGSGRFTMLETMRQFAMTKLIAAGEVEAVRERHADYFGAMAHTLAPALEGPGMLAALAELDQEIDNLRSALDWRIQQGRTDQAIRMAHALWLFWQRYRADEGAARLTEALALPGGEPASRALALISLADLLFYADPMSVTENHHEQALELAEQAGDARAIGRAKNVLGYGSIFTGAIDPTEALHEALRMHQAVGDAYFEIDTLGGLVLAAWLAGDRGLMRESAEGMISVAEANGNPQMHGRACTSAALAAYAQGDLDAAMAHCAAATEVATVLHDELVGPVVLAISARILGLRGHYDQAAAAALEANARSEAVNSMFGVAIALWADGLSLRDRGDNAAADVLDRACTLSEMIGLPIFPELCLARTRLTVSEGDAKAASDLAARLEGWTTRPLGAGARPSAALAEAEVAMLTDDVERARAAADVALTGAVTIGDQVLAVTALEFVAHLATLTRRHLEAARLYGAASAERGRLRTPVPPADRPRREADLAILEEAMGADALAAAVAEGDAMTIDAAAGYAQRGRGARRRSVAGWSSLTPTEIEVVKLVSEGLRNAEVAAQLFITVATVKAHLVHVFAKLDVANRSELTALAHSRT